jgi:DNA helicase-2/ATP-dependent DNA helicase PcrA
MLYNQPSRFLGEIAITHLESTGSIRSQSTSNLGVQDLPQGAKVSGSFKRASTNQSLMADPKNFNPSPSENIQTGMKVLHLKFGEGKVLSIDGGKGNRVATIFLME